MTPHERECQQREALALANKKRIAACHLRIELRSMGRDGWAAAGDAVLDEQWGHMRVGHLLSACQRFGEVRKLAVLTAAGVRSGDRRLRDMSPRQREVIASLLHDPSSLSRKAAA